MVSSCWLAVPDSRHPVAPDCKSPDHVRRIAGPTDPKSCVEFTSWQTLDRIAARIAELHGCVESRGGRGNVRPA
jgi:hypothetical protein